MPEAYPHVRELAVLQQGMQLVLSSLDADAVLHHILLISRNYFGALGSAVYLLEASSGELSCRAVSGSDVSLPKGRLALGKQTVAGWAAFTRAPLYISDLSKQTRHTVEGGGTGSVLALPLLVRDRVIGVLEIRSTKTDAFPPDTMSLLSVFSGQAAIALENAQLHSTDLRRVRQIEIINLIARSASAAQDRQQFFTMLSELLCDTFEGTMIAIALCSADGQVTVPAYAGTEALVLERFLAAREKGVIADAFSTRALALVNLGQARESWTFCFPNSGSELCAPLVSAGEVLGAIVLGHQRTNFFTAEDRTIAQAAADVCATAIKNVQLSEELRRVVNLDPFTGAYNQRYLHTALEQEIFRSRRHGKHIGLVMLDLHNLRTINNQIGLEAGDSLLRSVAQALRSNVRHNDLVCRYVADRFCVLLPELNSDGLTVVLGKLQDAVHGIEVPYREKPLPLTATWAAVEYPTDRDTAIELMKLLTSRLDEAKSQAAQSGG